jgi:hypothetical protein
MVLSGWLTPSAALDITLCCEDDLKRARQCLGSGTAGRCCASFPLSMLPEFRSSAPILGSDGVKSLVSALHTGHDCDIA